MKRAVLTFAALPPLMAGLFLLFAGAYLGFETLLSLQSEMNRPGALLVVIATVLLYLALAFFALRAVATIGRTRSARWLALIASILVIAAGILLADETDVFLVQDLRHAHLAPDSPPAFFLGCALLGLLGIASSLALLLHPAFSIPSPKIAQT